jgi:hypothetical protein
MTPDGAECLGNPEIRTRQHEGVFDFLQLINFERTRIIGAGVDAIIEEG